MNFILLYLLENYFSLSTSKMHHLKIKKDRGIKIFKAISFNANFFPSIMTLSLNSKVNSSYIFKTEMHNNI